MAKTIKESYGTLNSLNSLTMLKEDPCECPGGCDCEECGCGQNHHQMPQIDEDKKSERLAKIARAAAAREKDQAKEKEKATAKHNKASAKSRAGIKYRGNKDQFGRVRDHVEIDEAVKIPKDGSYNLNLKSPKKKVSIFVDHEAPDKDSQTLVYIEVNGKEEFGKEVSSSELKKILKNYLDAGKREGAKMSITDRNFPDNPMNEEVEQVDEAKSKSRIEMDKLMKKYGDMPVSKIPKKDYERIMQLRVSLREPSSSIRRHTSRDTIGRMGSLWAREKAESVEVKEGGLGRKRHGFTPDIIKKMKEVLVRSAEGDLDVAMKINATLPKDAQKVLTKVKDKRELAKKLGEESVEISEMDPKLHVSEKDGKFNVANIKGKIVKTFDNEKDAVDYAKANHDDLMKESMIGRTKPSRELNVQKDEKPHLAGVKSLKLQKRAASKAERKKGKQDIKKGK